MGLVLHYVGHDKRDRSRMRVHITAHHVQDETMCVVEGAIDAASAAHLAEALDVALGVEPRNTVLLDLTQVDWMALLDVRRVIGAARRTHPSRRIVVRHTTGRSREGATAVAPSAGGSRGSLAQTGPAPNTSDLIPGSAVR